MKIILEGCDGVGKTTLAKKLVELFGLEYQHDSAPRTYEEYWAEMHNGIPRVYDRFFFGQFAGYQEESERLMNKFELYDLVRDAKENGIPVIVCYDDIDEIVKRFKHNDSDIEWMNKMGVSSVREFIIKIQQGFIDIANATDCNYINFLDMSKIVPKKEG